jgi:hypothetical protein
MQSIFPLFCLGKFFTNPSLSPLTSLLSTSWSSASPPSSYVASPTFSPSYITSPLSRLGPSHSASVAPALPMHSASVALMSPSRLASTVPPVFPSSCLRAHAAVPHSWQCPCSICASILTISTHGISSPRADTCVCGVTATHDALCSHAHSF